MAAFKTPLLFCVFLALILIKVTSDPSPENQLKMELHQLHSKISSLELSIDKRASELRSKDESIRQMEIIIQEKSESIALLETEIESFQNQMGKPHTRADELDRQVYKLRKEIETQNKKKDALEARAKVAEKKIQALNLKLENLQKVNNEQKTMIHKTEHALQLAQEELMKAKLEATSISKELMEVHGGWLPHWLAVHLGHFKSYIVTHWNEHGKPALGVTIQKALENKAQVEKWAARHTKSMNTKWIPMVKEQWLTFITYLQPRVQLLTTRTVEVYHASKNSITPLVDKAQVLADPYIQEVRKFTKPYISQVVTVTKPHFDKAHVALKPYTKKVVRNYRKFIRSATKYHCQVQELLKNNELTKPVATMELAWFAATALLTLPVVFLFKLYLAISSKKPKKHMRSSHTDHTHRRLKRRHLDK